MYNICYKNKQQFFKFYSILNCKNHYDKINFLKKIAWSSALFVLDFPDEKVNLIICESSIKWIQHAIKVSFVAVGDAFSLVFGNLSKILFLVVMGTCWRQRLRESGMTHIKSSRAVEKFLDRKSSTSSPQTKIT